MVASEQTGRRVPRPTGLTWLLAALCLLGSSCTITTHGLRPRPVARAGAPTPAPGPDPAPLRADGVSPTPRPADTPRADRPVLDTDPTRESGRRPAEGVPRRPVPVADAGGPGGPVGVALFGDSLASEARAAFVFALGTAGGFSVETHTYGGTATCDWLEEMREVAATGDVDVAVLEFSGNALTPCMHRPDGTALDHQAFLDTYETATRDAVAALTAAGIEVHLATAPPSRREQPGSAAAALRQLYRDLAGELDGVEVVEAGDAVLDDGRYADTLPCLDFEDATHGCRDGRIVVRKPSDGAHFCPTDEPAVDGVVGSCPVWSSGAYRYGTAMAALILTAADSEPRT